LFQIDKSGGRTPTNADAFLAALRRDADTFRSFAELVPDSVPGLFYASVVDATELGATTPLLLWLLSENHSVRTARLRWLCGRWRAG
jgi:hypothetical protein